MSEMVERVAKACGPIIEQAVQGGRWPDGTIERVARAAITAMREPTEAMIDRGEYINSEWLNDNAPIGQRRYREPAKAVFNEMIGEALK